MEKLLAILASGIHDTRNQLFIAATRLGAAEAAHGVDLGEVRQGIEAAAVRLSRLLASYRLTQPDCALSLNPWPVDDLCAEAAAAQARLLAAAGLTLEVDCPCREAWICDRELVIDMLNNALQNAARHARRVVRLGAGITDDSLQLTVEDDGTGFTHLPPASGSGLYLAGRLAALHRRGEKCGELTLTNGGTLGGAVFRLNLP